ncbi:MAG: ABC transporter substrate-binding protein [Verrucomicrobia bacterium]|nr:ABC transporter substrate-binding protein [Verrucomicrobiota bacterium]
MSIPPRVLAAVALLAAALAHADPPRRIVSTVPALTEMLFAVGAGGQVIGVTQFCRYPPEAARCEKVGGYADLSFERLLALRPDLVVIADYSRHLQEQCRGANLPALPLKTDTIAEILDAMQKLGDVTGHTPEAQKAVAAVRAGLDAVRAQTAGRPPLRTLLVIGRQVGGFQGMLTVGARGFLNDLINIAGGTNVLADINQSWPQISLETVLARKPAAIIELMGEGMTADMSSEAASRRKQDWAKFGSLPAVAAGRVGVLLSDHALIPGPRIGDTARGIAELLR